MAISLDGTPENYIEPKNSITGSLYGNGLKIGIICARFNERITKSL